MNEIVEATISALAHGGAGLGTIETEESSNNGKKIFVRGTISGERVQAEISVEEKRYVEAKLLNIIEASPERVEPPCPVYGECGGCDYQHMSIAEERKAKREFVESTLLKQGKLEAKEGVKLIGEDLPEYGYRSRISLHLSEAGELGFYRNGTGDVVPITSCPISRPLISDAIETIGRFTEEIAPSFSKVTLEEVFGECVVVFSARPGIPAKHIPAGLYSAFSTIIIKKHKKERVLKASEGLQNVPFGHFSQVNELGNSLLIDTVVDAVKKGPVTDLYGGAGNFSIPIAKKGFKVTSVDLDPSLTNYGGQLAKQNELSVNFVTSSCEKFLKTHALAKTIVLDPPRSGAKVIARSLDPAKQTTVVYVSCSVPTLCRDLKALCDKGYTLEKVLVVDMFSQTHHVETVSILSA